MAKKPATGGAGMSEELALNINVGAMNFSTLKQLDQQLAGLEAQIERINRAMGRVNARSAKEFSSLIKQGGLSGQKTFSAKDLAGVVGGDLKATEAAIERHFDNILASQSKFADKLRNRLRGGSRGARSVESLGLASQVLASFERSNPTSVGQLAAWGGGGFATGAAPAFDMAAFSSSLKAGFAELAAAVKSSGGGRPAEGGGRKSGGKGGGGLGPANPATFENVVEQTITRTAKDTRTSFKSLVDADTTLTRTLNAKNELVREVTRLNQEAGKTLSQNLRNARRLARAGGGGVAGSAAAEAAAIDAFLASKDFKGLTPATQGRLRGDLASQAELLRARAREASEKQAEKAREDRLKEADANAKRRNELEAARLKGEQDYVRERNRMFRAQSRVDGTYAEQQRAFDAARNPASFRFGDISGREADFARWARAFDARAGGPGSPGGSGNRGVGGRFGDRVGGFFSGAGVPGGLASFLGDVAHVGRWASAVTVAYSAANLLVGSLQTLLEVGHQVARLDQVFSGVGGTSQQLANDVLGTAAALGRERTEALESAIAWSRLGLTRQQVNEAVRVSLTAANVAEIDALSATENLLAIMAAYKLEVRELSGVLDLLNETSNNFNVTNKDLLEGIQRTGAVAQQAGLSLAGLVGLLGVGVGTTGQSGSNIGNSLKALTLNLANPDRQEYLRRAVGIEVLADDQGALKPLPNLLDEIAIAYEKLNDQERGVLIERLAGKFQASRITALLEGYAKANVLAANSLVGFNSAGEENARITATLKNSLTGLAGVAKTGFVAATAEQSKAAGKFLDNVRVIGNEYAGPVGEFAGNVAARYPKGPVRRSFEMFAAGTQRVADVIRARNAQGDPEVQLRGEAEGLRTAAREMRRELLRQEQGLAPNRAVAGLDARYLPESLPRDPAVAAEMLRKQAARLEGEAAEREAEARALREQLIQDKEAEVLDLERQREALRGKNPAKEENIRKSLTSAEDALAKLRRRPDPVTMDAEGKYVEDTTVSIRAFSSAITDLKNSLTGLAATPLGRFNTELAFLEAASGKMSLTKDTRLVPLKMELDNRLQVMRQQQPLAEFQNRLDIGGRLAGARADSFLIGDTEGERLLEQRKRLAESQQALRERGLRTEAEQIQFLFQAKQLEENRLRLLERQFSVARELEELKRTARREESRALANAGPDEILRRLAARQLGGVDNANQFLSLSPDLRGLLAADPDSPFNVDANRLREDQRRTGAFNFFSQYGGIGGLPSLGGGGDPMLENILQSFADNLPTEALARMTEVTDASASAVKRFGDQLDVVSDRLEQLAAAAPAPADLMDTGKQPGLTTKRTMASEFKRRVGQWLP